MTSVPWAFLGVRPVAANAPVSKRQRAQSRGRVRQGKYFEIDSNKRSGAADVMRHPAIKRSAFAVVVNASVCAELSLLADRYWQSVNRYWQSVRSRTHGIHEHGTSRIRASRRIAASFHREDRDLDEDKGE